MLRKGGPSFGWIVRSVVLALAELASAAGLLAFCVWVWWVMLNLLGGR